MANTIRTSLHWFFLFISVFCSPQIISAQISEDFSDGNLSQSPEWFGDINRFTINESGQLQLFGGSISGSSMLMTPNSCFENCEWHFYIRLSFSPSANNNTRVYLASDQPDLGGELNGYYLQFGESGSEDAIELFIQKGAEATSICRGTNASISSSFALNVKVLHLPDGSWELYSDLLDGKGYIKEASGFNNEITNSEYFGFLCKYTSSNSEKMYFDDIYAGPVLVDHSPPEISCVHCLSDSSLGISFTEAITEESGLNPINYFVSEAIGNPQNIQFSENRQETKLFFDTTFENRKVYQLGISNLYDLSGNRMKDTAFLFSYFEALPLDIVINEIMDDPSPAVELPEFEFIELFNRSIYDIDLTGWSIEINDKTLWFAETIFPAQTYLIVCNHSASESFSDLGNVYSFSGFLLPNSGSALTLKNKQGEIISFFEYQKSQFSNSDKNDGGWSIEQMNPENICFGIDNWAYSTDGRGGSPSGQNSVFSTLGPPPEIIHFEVMNDQTLQLDFINSMDLDLIQNLSFYLIQESSQNPDQVIVGQRAKSLQLIFSAAFEKNHFYTLKIASALKNCIGMSFTEDQFFSFGIPDLAAEQDLVINEILFSPLNQGEEYIELYNRSDKMLDLSNLEICLINTVFPHPPDTNCTCIANEETLIFPKNYYVLSRSPEKVMAQYDCPNPDRVITVDNLVRLTDNGGLLGIKTKNNLFIDLVEYNENMHYPLLNFTEGVALEKIHFDLPGLVHSNWLSASFASGFGTPTYQNSQFSETQNGISEIMVSPHVFTPNNDGRDDVLKIEYQLDQSGYTANVIIFTSEGFKIKQLVNNELLGTKGVFCWNGFDEHDEKMPRGIYIIFIELFDLEGHIKRYKETAILGEAF